VSAESRYFYVDAQNQASGPIAMAELLALKAAGTLTDATLVVVEGGTEWVAFSTLKAEGAGALPSSSAERATSDGGQPAAGAGALPSSSAERARSDGGQPAAGAGALPSSSAERARSDGGSSSTEPPWASQLASKIEQLTSTMEKLVIAMEKARPMAASAPVMAPATAALHAERINLNPAPKPGIAAQNPAAAPGAVPRPTPLPIGVPPATPGAIPRPGIATPLSPLAVPANAQKSALPLPALGQATTPAPAPAPAKGNIFSKFLKK
jgi:hypothetical protein